MSNKLDTSWFKLENYKGLEDLDLYGWYQHLKIREQIKNVLLSYEEISDIERKLILSDIESFMLEDQILDRELFDSGGFNEWTDLSVTSTLKLIEEIKHRPVFKVDKQRKLKSDSKYSFDTPSIKSLSAFQIYMLKVQSEYELETVWRYCDRLCEGSDIYDKEAELINTPYDLLANEYYLTENNGLAHISIDLTSSDEQLKQNFSAWLTKYREETKFFSQKTMFSDQTLLDWQNERLLPCIDLMLVALVEKKKITNLQYAEAIFGDKTGEMKLVFSDRIRRTIKNNAKNLIRKKTLDAIYTEIKNL